MRRAANALLLWPVLLCSQSGPSGTSVRPKATDYPAHAEAGGLSLGAEYLVHSVPLRSQTFVAADYLVVEVALYPPRGEDLAVQAGQFTLRLNGKKQVLLAQPAAFVAASMKYPDWEQRPTLTAGGGLGNTGVILGAPPQTGRFPGDRRDPQSRLPAPPRVPEQTPGGVEREPPMRGEEAVLEAALPEDPARGPVAGYLYFPYKGKTKSIRKLELLYESPAGTVTLPLLP